MNEEEKKLVERVLVSYRKSEEAQKSWAPKLRDSMSKLFEILSEHDKDVFQISKNVVIFLYKILKPEANDGVDTYLPKISSPVINEVVQELSDLSRHPECNKAMVRVQNEFVNRCRQFAEEQENIVSEQVEQKLLLFSGKSLSYNEETEVAALNKKQREVEDASSKVSSFCRKYKVRI